MKECKADYNKFVPLYNRAVKEYGKDLTEKGCFHPIHMNDSRKKLHRRLVFGSRHWINFKKEEKEATELHNLFDTYDLSFDCKY